MNKKRRTLLLVAVLLLAAVILSGCAVPQGQLDLSKPPNTWDAVVVYPLAKLLIAMNGFLANLGVAYSWGWAIIVFTVLVKIVTLPLTLKQLQSTKAQQQVQPKMRELQEKYGKDRQKLAEEQMKLYKEAGINPMGGCLPDDHPAADPVGPVPGAVRAGEPNRRYADECRVLLDTEPGAARAGGARGEGTGAAGGVHHGLRPNGRHAVDRVSVPTAAVGGPRWRT